MSKKAKILSYIKSTKTPTKSPATGRLKQSLRGEKGDKGKIGPRGPKGDKGDKGDPGEKPVLGVDYFVIHGKDGRDGDSLDPHHYVPYVGAIKDVDLGNHTLYTDGIHVDGYEEDTPIGPGVNISYWYDAPPPFNGGLISCYDWSVPEELPLTIYAGDIAIVGYDNQFVGRSILIDADYLTLNGEAELDITGSTISITGDTEVDGTLTTTDLATFPSVWHTEAMYPTADAGVWVGYVKETYDEDLETYILDLTTALTTAQLVLINAFVVGLKTDLNIDNLTELFDVMYYTGNETAESSLRNMVKREHDGVAVNSPTFTPYEGWVGDGVSSYIDFNYNPNTDAVNVLQDNLCAGYYSRTDTGNSESIFGARGTIARLYLLLNVEGTTGYYYVNTTNPGGAVLANNNGMIGLIREASATHRLYRNKVQVDSEADASEGLPNCNLCGLACNNNGVIFSPATSQLSFVFVGRLDATGMENITDRFETLMDANGKGVIT